MSMQCCSLPYFFRAQAYVLKPTGERLRARKTEKEEYSVYDCELTVVAYFPPNKGNEEVSGLVY